MTLLLQSGLIGQGASGICPEEEDNAKRGKKGEKKEEEKLRTILAELRVMELTHFGTAPGPQPLLLQLLPGWALFISCPHGLWLPWPPPMQHLAHTMAQLPLCLVPEQIRWGVSPSAQATEGLWPFCRPPQVFRPQPATMS